MNKRFSTLLATALVAGGLSASAGPINPAGTLVPAGVKDGQNVLLNEALGANFGSPLFIKDSDGKLSTNWGATPTAVKDIMAGVWKITIIPSQTLNGLPTYKFVNKKTGEALAIVLQTNNKGASTTEPKLDESGNQEWSWNTQLGLYASTADSTFFLEVRTGSAYLKAVKGGAAEAVAAGATAFRLDPTTDGLASVSLTPADFNYLVGTSKQLYFNNGKDVQNSTATPANILTAKKWQASSAEVGKGNVDATKFLLATDSADNKASFGKTAKYLVVDTTYYDLAKTELNRLTIDTLKTNAVYTSDKLAQATFDVLKAATTLYSEKTTDGVTTYKAIRPIETATFSGEYYFANDSLVLFAVNKPGVLVATSGAGQTGADKLNTITAGTVYANAVDGLNGGQIALRVLDQNKIVLTPAPDKTDLTTEAKAEAANFKLPLIQVGEMEAAADGRTSVADGLYFIKNNKDQYWGVPIHATKDSILGAQWVTINPSEQNVADMPAFQWVVLKSNTADRVKDVTSINVTNREFAKTTANIQLYKNAGASYAFVANGKDSLNYAKIDDKTILGDTLLGYRNFSKDELSVNRIEFNYYHPYAKDKFIAKNDADSLLTVLDGVTSFVLTPDADAPVKYGYNVTKAAQDRIKDLKQLYRNTYMPKLPVKDGNNATFGLNAEDQYFFSAVSGKSIKFLFKTNNEYTIDSKILDYHAMIDLTDTTKVGVNDNDAKALLKNQVMSETRTSVFHIGPNDAPLYRRFNNAELEGNEGDASDTLRFVEKYRGEMLQVESNTNFTVKGIDFLGIYTPEYGKPGKSFIVDTAFVNRHKGEIKPQYLISIDRNDSKKGETIMCEVCEKLVAEGKPRPEGCIHDQIGKYGFNFGSYLVNFADSTDAKYQWKKYTRAGFVKAAHIGDSLYILKDQFADVTALTFDTTVIRKAVADKKYAAANIIDVAKNDTHKNVTWSMRYVDPSNAATSNKTFLIESDKKDSDQDIAPLYGAWLKSQNGCLVLSDKTESRFDIFTAGDDALIFDVKKGGKDDLAVDNETITTTEVSVIAGQGSVRIAGAEGKKVVISNILGQVIANTVITSSDATIAAPQGVVVVAVEGEEAVKAIVK